MISRIKIGLGVAVALSATGCATMGVASDQATASAKTPDLTACIRKVMELDEGRWNYMGTVARLNGAFRTFETTSVHEKEGEDLWSFKSFGGDVSEEESGEITYVRLVANQVIPVEDGVLQTDNAITYKTCTGPDLEGRYTTTLEYTLPDGDNTLYADNLTWSSEMGSYYAEDVRDEAGRIVARRSGVNTPADPTQE